MDKQRKHNNGTCAHPLGKGIETGPENSPGLTTFSQVPNMMLLSVRNDTVQKGLRKSWWSMCGGMQHPFIVYVYDATIGDACAV